MSVNSRAPYPAWWKFGYVWLVIAGPAVVVVAGFVTLYLAIVNPDPVIKPDYYRQGIAIDRAQGAGATAPGSIAPAVQARNHAATGVVPVPADAAKP